MEKKDIFSEEVWKKHGLLVTKENALKSMFETNHIIKKGEIQNNVTRYNNNSYSFLGTTPEEYLVENPDYPADAGKILQFENFNWTKNLNDETRLVLPAFHKEREDFVDIEFE